MTGEVLPVAKTTNSRLTQAGTIDETRVFSASIFLSGADLLARRPEQVGQHDAEAGVDHPVGEGQHLGRDPRHLGDDDDGRARPLAEHVPGLAVVGEGTPFEEERSWSLTSVNVGDDV